MNAATLGEVPAENMGSPGSSVLLRPVEAQSGVPGTALCAAVRGGIPVFLSQMCPQGPAVKSGQCVQPLSPQKSRND